MNKICLFFDCCDIATFYTKFLLKRELEAQGHKCDLYVTPSPGQYCFSKDNFSKSSFFKDDIFFALPDPSAYDCIFVGARHNKNHLPIRYNVINSFLSNNKKTIIFQDAANLDFAGYPNCTSYGLPSLNQINLVKTAHLHLKNIHDKFIFEVPVLSNLSWEKPDFCRPLSKDDFYDFYQISKSHKIVSWFPDGEHGHPSAPASHWMHQNLNNISEYLKTKGYQVVSKLHPYEYFGRKREYYNGAMSNTHYKWNTPVILEEHAHELIKYSTFALSSISCVAWEHYLYRLPHLNVGMHASDRDSLKAGQINGYEHFINVGYNSQHIHETKFDILSLIYGHVYSFDSFKNDYKHHIDDFLDNRIESSVENFKYDRNHPILGQSLNSSISDVANTLVSVLNNA